MDETNSDRYCWHVYRQSMFVIDGKKSSDDGMVTGKNCNDVGRFTVGSALIINGKNNDGKHASKEEQQQRWQEMVRKTS